ncbi:MAG TPA: diaminobutyrate acetyltransferase [Thermoanaerobaculia bacterium]|nr:diaminobutyrate acetyltransferase [Thermoanaerobaculia bacterium]
MRLRRPRPEDAARVWRLVRDSDQLDVNSPYAYLLLCSHFRDTCLLAEDGDKVEGAVLGYSPPETPSSLFVWQIAVAEEARGRGLARQLLVGALATARPVPRWLEATVTPDNTASLALFRSVARCLDAGFERRPHFPAELFPDSHAEEHHIRIGPLAAEDVDRAAENRAQANARSSPTISREPNPEARTGDPS